jgi:hypothetical protein
MRAFDAFVVYPLIVTLMSTLLACSGSGDPIKTAQASTGFKEGRT